MRICLDCGNDNVGSDGECYRCKSHNTVVIPTGVYSPPGVNPKDHHRQLRQRFISWIKECPHKSKQTLEVSLYDMAHLNRHYYFASQVIHTVGKSLIQDKYLIINKEFP